MMSPYKALAPWPPYVSAMVDLLKCRRGKMAKGEICVSLSACGCALFSVRPPHSGITERTAIDVKRQNWSKWGYSNRSLSVSPKCSAESTSLTSSFTSANSIWGLRNLSMSICARRRRFDELNVLCHFTIANSRLWGIALAKFRSSTKIRSVKLSVFVLATSYKRRFQTHPNSIAQATCPIRSSCSTVLW